jgi:hypothetical protein
MTHDSIRTYELRSEYSCRHTTAQHDARDPTSPAAYTPLDSLYAVAEAVHAHGDRVIGSILDMDNTIQLIHGDGPSSPARVCAYVHLRPTRRKSRSDVRATTNGMDDRIMDRMQHRMCAHQHNDSRVAPLLASALRLRSVQHYQTMVKLYRILLLAGLLVAVAVACCCCMLLLHAAVACCRVMVAVSWLARFSHALASARMRVAVWVVEMRGS